MSLVMAQCKRQMIRDGADAVPRTCPKCGLGKCRDGLPVWHEMDRPKPAPASPWLQTRHPERARRKFDLMNPTAAMVSLTTMAKVLARVARFAGHTEGAEIYSVAQHSVEGCRAILRDGHGQDVASAFLMHDGHEYLMGDWPTPVQQALSKHAELDNGTPAAGECVKRAIKSLKNSLDRPIHEAAGLAWPLPEHVRKIVKEYDLRMGRTERDARMAEPPAAWDDIYSNAEPVKGCDLSPWPAAYAESMFALWCFRTGISVFGDSAAEYVND